MKELKEYLEWNNLLLTSTINVENEILDRSYYIELCQYVDLMHFVPRYPVGSNREYYTIAKALKEHGISNLDLAIDRLLELGVPASKIVIGINFGGFKFDFSSWSKQYVGYNHICSVISDNTQKWMEIYDSAADLAVAKKKDNRSFFWQHVIVFENRQSIISRVRLTMRRNLAGVMANFINTDDLHGKCVTKTERYNDFNSPHVVITLKIPAITPTPLLNTINIMMVMALHEINQEAKISNLEYRK